MQTEASRYEPLEPTPMLLTKSKFFIDAFNTAIIDGPLRIYFSDKNEAEALHIYFEIQETLANLGLQLTALSSLSKHTFVMLYPNENDYAQVFSKNNIYESKWQTENFGENIIFGLKNHWEKEVRIEASQKVSGIIQSAAAL